MTADPHADLRAMVEALLKQMPNESYTYYANRTVGSWFLRAPALVRDLLEERDKLDNEVGRLSGDAEWISNINKALGDDRNKAPFIDDAVRLLRKERDALKAERDNLAALLGDFANGKLWSNRGELDAALAERLDADPAFRKEMHAAWRERLLAFEEEKMRCMMAATVLPILAQWGKEHGIEGPFRDAVVNEAHHYADALIAEARRRKECKHEWHRELVGPDPSGESVAVDTCRKCQRKEVGRDLA